MGTEWTCVNTECTEAGIAKGSLDPIPLDTEVICGECGRPCDGSAAPE